MKIDSGTERAVRAFIVKVAGQYDLAGVVLFGSRARGNFYPKSDADIAVLLHGVPGRRVDAALKMADIAFDVTLETMERKILCRQNQQAGPSGFSRGVGGHPPLVDWNKEMSATTKGSRIAASRRPSLKTL